MSAATCKIQHYLKTPNTVDSVKLLCEVGTFRSSAKGDNLEIIKQRGKLDVLRDLHNVAIKQ
jgi:hypothetical protein